MDRKIVASTISIQAPAPAVWHTLVSAEQTKQYMFGCEAISEWKEGSPLEWKMMHEGKELIPVRGVVEEIIPNKRLKYTVIDTMASYPDIPQNHLHVTYELAEQNGVTELTVMQDGFEDAADGEKRYQDVYNNGEGWNPILVQIKKVAESLQ